MAVKVQVVFYSMYGHIYRMAEAVAEGAREVAGAEVALFQVPELVPDEALSKSGAKAARAGVRPRPGDRAGPARRGRRDHLRHADPVREHVRPDAATSSTDRRALGSAGRWSARSAASSPAPARQHGGQETTITSFHTTLLHHGMIIVGVPYSEPGARRTWPRSPAGRPTGPRPWPAPTAAAAERERAGDRPVPGPARRRDRRASSPPLIRAESDARSILPGWREESREGETESCPLVELQTGFDFWSQDRSSCPQGTSVSNFGRERVRHGPCFIPIDVRVDRGHQERGQFP